MQFVIENIVIPRGYSATVISEGKLGDGDIFSLFQSLLVVQLQDHTIKNSYHLSIEKMKEFKVKHLILLTGAEKYPSKIMNFIEGNRAKYRIELINIDRYLSFPIFKSKYTIPCCKCDPTERKEVLNKIPAKYHQKINPEDTMSILLGLQSGDLVRYTHLDEQTGLKEISYRYFA